ncbi:helix-turn-helix transcriptional regulator [Rhodobacter capsulatus]|uniref:Transcriptional regulator, AraC family n=1 Tax=Rhodobacter capsulatus (strain ATCC BAA-309 / NBRC 16581 / SB1003) TaxID=272942 RepID=D5AR02_RHOCB|nr:AraC family transcriptional regulator [Rhodobacter capsulatus]ADE84808.1 transcriptional regulator, AraC family [Rhodobacter capsulatus SB 1003]ETD02446.1 hypothetical protein U714_06455 [Rhodobacter capsulatus DE442]ETD78412.1 hypothetical protein U717_06460 [Rhodobacter capsulatus R121]ETE54526.1 hypothetical protein U715_06450 [Rhodobacter capsulatus Y262]MDS0925788.1 helix-turn-helix transcriptional regulator [Rhodobacter capsulatus]
MSIQHFPGDFRLGVLNEPRLGVIDPTPGRVEPKLMVFLLLGGHQRFVLGGRRIEMDARTLPDGALFRIGKPTEVVFEHNVGQPLTKLSLAMPPDWLDGLATPPAGALTDLRQDLAVLRFLPGPAPLETARRILREKTPLRRMALGMTLLDQVIAGLAGQQPETLARPLPEDPGGGLADGRTDGPAILARLRREIAATAGEKLAAPDLARRCGIGLRSLERLVHETEGRSLGALIRAERMEMALRSLRGGASVTRAAHLAGYGSAANFATALRNRSGITPTEARRRPPAEG